MTPTDKTFSFVLLRFPVRNNPSLVGVMARFFTNKNLVYGLPKAISDSFIKKIRFSGRYGKISV